MLLQRLARLLGDPEGRVVRVHHDEDVVEHVLQVLLERLHRLEEELQAVEAEEVGQDRHEQVVRRHQGVQVQEAEAGRSVEHRVVVSALDLLHRVAQAELARGEGHEREVDGAHAQVRGYEIQPWHPRADDDLLERRLLDDGVEERALRLLAGDPQALGGVPLRVQVDDQHAVPHLRQAEGIAGRDAGLAGAALEVEEELLPHRPARRLPAQRPARAGQVVDGVRGALRRFGAQPRQHAARLGLGQLLRGKSQHFGEPASGVADGLH